MITINDRLGSFYCNFGNKLFIYGIASYLASLNSSKLSIGNVFEIRRDGTNYKFPYGNIEGQEILEPSYILEEIPFRPFNEIIESCKDKRVNFNGFFLRYDIIKQIKPFIKELYKDLILPNDEKNDVIILLRSSNIDPTFILPDEYYLNILKELKFDNLYISLDHKDRHYRLLDKLAPYEPIILDTNSVKLLKLITSKKTLVCCQGTYSFWAAFLSNAEKIYWPITKIGPNRLDDNLVNLKIDDDARIEFINVW